MRIETVTLPAFLASALINGDTSGLDENDEELLQAVHEYLTPGHAVSCGRVGHFASIYLKCQGKWFRGDVIEYTVLYPEES